MIKPKSPKDDQWGWGGGGGPMAKYKQGKADIRSHENRTIWNTEPDWNTKLVSLSQAGTSTARSSSINNLGLHRGRIQEVWIIISRVIIWCLTSGSGHQCPGHGNLC
jgi:hypothetical protein